MKFWRDEIKRGEAGVFSTLNDFLTESNSKMDDTDFKKDIEVHLNSLIDNFDKYYPENEEIVKDDWIRDPFFARDLPAHFDHKENEELIDLVTDVSLQANFMKEELADFWLRRRATHSLLSDLALKFIMPFVTSYLCEQGFSSMLYVKNKYTSQSKDLDKRLRLKLTNIEPDFAKLCSSI